MKLYAMKHSTHLQDSRATANIRLSTNFVAALKIVYAGYARLILHTCGLSLLGIYSALFCSSQFSASKSQPERGCYMANQQATGDLQALWTLILQGESVSKLSGMC